MNDLTAAGLDLPDLPEGRVRAPEIEGRCGSIDIARAEQIDAARTEVVHGQTASLAQLPLDAAAELDCVWRADAGLEHDDAGRSGCGAAAGERVRIRRIDDDEPSQTVLARA